MTTDALRRLGAELDEGVLHHIPGTICIVQEGAGVGDERRLEIGDRLLKEGFAGDGWW